MRASPPSKTLRRARAGFAAVLAVWGIVTLSRASTQASSPEASISIDATLVEGHISPTLYGDFMEFMYQDIKGGLTAELLRDRSFEELPNSIGLPRNWERDPDDRNDDPGLHLEWTDQDSIPRKNGETGKAEHSIRIQIGSQDGQRRGLRQGDIPVHAGDEYRGYVWIKASSFSGRVIAALEQDTSGGESYASAELHPAASLQWKKYEFTLRANKSDAHAKLSLTFYGRGTLLVDDASLVPGDATDGVRKDVFERVQALHPAFVRWPGGNVAQDYHWMWAIGPRDERTTWTNYSWGKEPEPGDFGTDEYIQFCRNLHAQPSITVNVEGRGATAQEAANWVEYANGSPATKFGSLRAANGHREAYQVPLWEVGNEIWGSWVSAHSDAAAYAQNFNRYYSAMHSADPSIKFISVGDNNLQWDRTVLANAGKGIDYLAIHHYYGAAEMHGDIRNLMAHPLKYEAFYKQLQSMIHQLAPGKDIKLAINEWNTSLPLPDQHSMVSALYAARLMNVFERSGDIIGMTAISDLVNGWSGGVVQAGRDSVFVTPTYHAIRMYSEHLGTERLQTAVDSPTFDSSREGKRIPYLDAVATRSSDRHRLFLKVVNTNLEHDIASSIRIKGLAIAAHAQWEVLTAPDLKASNTFSNPDEVTPKMRDLDAGNSFQIIFPAHSVSVISFEVR